MKTASLFIATFLSAFLLLFGVGTLFLMFAPALTEVVTPRPIAAKLLPLAEDREYAHLDAAPARQLYPPLTEVTDTAAGNWIRIPSIGVAVPLALSPSLNDSDVIATLDSGAALYPNGIEPGRLGNTFVAAHSTGEPWKGTYRFAFLKINEIEDGNLVHLDYEGTRYTYRVTNKEIVTPSPDFVVVSDRPVPTVTLMACWPLWTRDQRMLLTAQLTNVTPLTTPAPESV